MTTTHFTAWLVNDTSCLDQDNCDITILQDQLIAGDPEDDHNWATDASKPTAFHAITSVNAKNGDIDAALDEARTLMAAAGWQLVGGWEAADNAYTVTVEKDADDSAESVCAECGTDTDVRHNDPRDRLECGDCTSDADTLADDQRHWRDYAYRL